MQNININYFSNTKLCMIVLDARDHAVVVDIYRPPPKKLQSKIIIKVQSLSPNLLKSFSKIIARSTECLARKQLSTCLRINYVII